MRTSVSIAMDVSRLTSLYVLFITNRNDACAAHSLEILHTKHNAKPHLTNRITVVSVPTPYKPGYDLVAEVETFLEVVNVKDEDLCRPPGRQRNHRQHDGQ